ncbi:MAG: hypothetical protein ACKOAU_07015 [Pirellula sp.]
MSIPEPKVAHHHGRGIRSCPIFPELRLILDEAFEIFGSESEYVVAHPGFRAAANTPDGLEELVHVVCSWLGNSPQVAQQSYLLVTEDDFERAAGAKKVMVP